MDSVYTTYSYRFENKGLVARYVNDALPLGSYQNLDNLESRAENAIASRLGLAALTTNGTINFPLYGGAFTLSRMNGLDQGFRYAAAANTLFRRQGDTNGAYTPVLAGLTVATGSIALVAGNFVGTLNFTDGTINIAVGSIIAVNGCSLSGLNGPSFTVNASGPGFVKYNTVNQVGGSVGGIVYTAALPGLSGNRLSMFPYRPDANSSPYQFIADTNVLLKDSGTFAAAQPWGIAPPRAPAICLVGDPQRTVLEQFDEADATSFTLAGYTGAAILSRLSATIGAVPVVGLQQVQILTATITAFARAANVMTITTALPHGFSTGTRVAIRNLADLQGNVTSAPITVTGASTFTYANIGPNNGAAAAGIADPSPSFMPGMLITVSDGGNTETVLVDDVSVPFFTSKFAHTHLVGKTVTAKYLNGNIAANTTATISKAKGFDLSTFGAVQAEDNDVLGVFLQISDPLAITEIKLLLDVGDGTFTQDYFYKSISPATWQPAVSGTRTTGDIQTNRIFDRAGARADPRQVGRPVLDLMPFDLVDLPPLRPVELNTGLLAWTLIQARRGEFVKVGAAGLNTNFWNSVVAWRVEIKTAPNQSAVVSVDDFIFSGASGIDSLGEDPYDYRYTYYNINTGDESNPSITMIDANFLAVQRKPISVTFLNPTDRQVTHVRLYRRGGTLTQAWYKVVEIPIAVFTGSGVYLDTIDDGTIEENKQLEIDNDPPVTSIMRAPVNQVIGGFAGGPVPPLSPALLATITVADTSSIFPGQIVTIGAGATQEQCYVVSVPDGVSFTVIAQFQHLAGEIVSATTRPQRAMNLMAIAFDKAWLAGDPDNPHVLYYSKTYRPETFAPQNFIEIGTPSSPIMALIEQRGLLYVFTTTRVWQVLGAGSAVPIAIPTGVKHGLMANFAWAAAENVIYYLSYDGVYVFQGSGSPYLTEQTEWLWTGKNLGPVPAMDLTQKDQTFMSYCNHEVFVSYIDTNGSRRRLIYHDVYSRWRNDSTTPGGITAEFFEDDTGEFIVAKDDNMVYIDRVNDYDSGGFVGGSEIKNAINFTMQTAQMDMETKKAFKVYNELTLDIDTQGQDVAVTLLFDNGTTPLVMDTINTSGRTPVQLNINDGEGQRSLNIGILLTGSVRMPVTLYEVHIRALVEAELRQSFDSYWMKWGTDEWKIVKQGWFEYQNTADIVFQVFIEGSDTARYTFTLPAANKRTTLRKRFPPVKAKMWRFVATSTEDFALYDESHIEQKPIGGPKGYVKQKLAA